jgi:hypothetical protein
VHRSGGWGIGRGDCIGAALRAFQDAKSVNFKEVSSAPELTCVQIVARASAFTVLIECKR